MRCHRVGLKLSCIRHLPRQGSNRKVRSLSRAGRRISEWLHGMVQHKHLSSRVLESTWNLSCKMPKDSWNATSCWMSNFTFCRLESVGVIVSRGTMLECTCLLCGILAEAPTQQRLKAQSKKSWELLTLAMSGHLDAYCHTLSDPSEHIQASFAKLELFIQNN